MENAGDLAGRLRGIVEHHRVHGARGLDAAVCQVVEDAQAIGYQDVQDIVVTLMTAVDEALTSNQCKDKRAIQRGWVVGLVAGTARRGMPPEDVAYIMAYNGLRCAVDLAMILAVYAFSLAWGHAQAAVRLGWPADLKPRLLEAMERGLHDAESHLGGEVQPQERRWMRENLVTGWRAGAVLARFLPSAPLPAPKEASAEAPVAREGAHGTRDGAPGTREEADSHAG